MNEFELKHTMFWVERDKTQQLDKDVAEGTRKAQATKGTIKRENGDKQVNWEMNSTNWL